MRYDAGSADLHFRRLGRPSSNHPTPQQVSDICWDHSHSSVKLLLEPAATAEGEAAATNNGEDAGDGKVRLLCLCAQ